MEIRSSHRLVVVVLACLAASGCFAGLRHVRPHFAASMACPETSLRVRQLNDVLWDVEGCGIRAQHVCWGRKRTLECRPVAPMGYGGRAFVAALEAASHAAPTGNRGTRPAWRAPAMPASPTAPRTEVASEDGPGARERTAAFFQSVARPVRACAPAALPLALTVELQPDGRVTSVTGMVGLPIEQQLCVMTALQSTSVPGGLEHPSSARFVFR